MLLGASAPSSPKRLLASLSRGAAAAGFWMHPGSHCPSCARSWSPAAQPLTALGQIPLCLPGPCWPPLPYSTSKEGTDQPPSTNPAPLCSYSRKHSLGRQTWRVVEEVDNALLGCVEEGSGHRVVLSISTEKLRRGRKKNELKVADMGCPGAARTAGLWLAEEPRADLGTWGTPAELRAGHRVREENGMKSERGRCFSRISGLAASHVSVQPKRKVPKP